MLLWRIVSWRMFCTGAEREIRMDGEDRGGKGGHAEGKGDEEERGQEVEEKIWGYSSLLSFPLASL